MTATYGPFDRTTLNALSPNLDTGDVADPALRLAYFQYLADYGDAIYSGVKADIASKISAGALSALGIINVKDYGASGSDTTTTGNLASGSQVLVVASTDTFLVGHGISVAGAGEAGADLVTSITSIVGTNVFLADEASTTVSGATVSHDDTVAFTAMAAVGNPMIIPSGQYNLSSGFEITNSIIGIGSPILSIQGDGAETCRLIKVIDQTDGNRIEISGLYLDGGYDGVGTDGEQSHLVYIANSKNVHVFGNVIDSSYGDCVYIGSNEIAPSENIHVYKNKLLNPRRCNVAIVAGKKVWVQDNDMEKGISYVATIDLEPNDNTWDVVEDVWIERNVFDSQGYFVNMFNPLSDGTVNIQRIKISGNKGKAHYFLRSPGTSGVNDQISITDNEYYGSNGDARMFAISTITGLEIRRNRDYATGSSGWNLTELQNPIVSENYIESARSIALQFVDCQEVRCTDNVIVDVFSGNGSLIFSEGVVGGTQIGHIIQGNQFINSDFAISVGAVLSSCLIDGNIIDSNRRGISIGPDALGSDIRITDTNLFYGAGTPIIGGANAGNQGIGYKTSIAAAPAFIGEIAVVSGEAYIATGTASTADWEKITP